MKLFQIAWGEAAAVEGVSLPEWEVSVVGAPLYWETFTGSVKESCGCPGATGVTCEHLGEKPENPTRSEQAEGKQIPPGLSQASRQNQGAGLGWVGCAWIPRQPCWATVPVPAPEQEPVPALLPSQPSPVLASCKALASIPCDTDVPAPTEDDTYKHVCKERGCARWPLPVFLGKGWISQTLNDVKAQIPLIYALSVLFC